MNDDAETKVKARVEKSVELRLLTGSSEAGNRATETQDGNYHEVTHVPPHLANCASWENNAVAMFFADYLLSSDVMKETFYPFLSNLCCGELISCQYLKEALHAAAFTSYGNQLGVDFMVLEGSLAYNRALSLLANELQDEVTSKGDTIIATTFLLGLYEVYYYYISSCYIRKS